MTKIEMFKVIVRALSHWKQGNFRQIIKLIMIHKLFLLVEAWKGTNLLFYFISESASKKMFNEDEGKIECAVGNSEICFGRARKPRLF